MIEKGHKITVHEHGFVRYIDHMGSDVSIVEAVRVSYKSPSKGPEADKKLLGYLLRNRICKVKFNIRMPIFVMRQYIRHRMQNVNEVSARYTELPDVFFLPKVWRWQDVKNKQSSMKGERQLEMPMARRLLDRDGCDYYTKDIGACVEDFYERAYELYLRLLEGGVSREQACVVLPLGIYTEFYCCWDLNNLLKYFALRDHPHAQAEHQDYARAMKQITAEVFPWTMELYESVRFRWSATMDETPTL